MTTTRLCNITTASTILIRTQQNILNACILTLHPYQRHAYSSDSTSPVLRGDKDKLNTKENRKTHVRKIETSHSKQSVREPHSKNVYMSSDGVTEISKEDQISYLKATKQVLEQRVPPKVDLKSSRGISVHHSKTESKHTALLRHYLEEQPNIKGFSKAVELFIAKNKYRRGHIDFIVAGLKFVEAYGLEKELEVYNKLIDVFPRDRFNNRSFFDVVWPKPHPQINLALDILTKMEWQAVMPSEETHELLYQIFGRNSFPLMKVYRMWFWFESFKDINPYVLPDHVYKDRLEIVKAGIDRILGNNDGTHVVELSQPFEVEGRSDYQQFIVSSQSSYQRECVIHLDVHKPLYVEGPIHIWMNHFRQEYFVLKTGREDLVTRDLLKVQEDEEREGVVLAVCFTSKPYTENLQKWIKHLQEENPELRKTNIVFDLHHSPADDSLKTIAAV